MIAIFLWLFLGWIALLAVLSFVGNRHLQRLARPSGQIVDVDGTTVHLMAKGEADETRPSLIFVHGASSNYREFLFALEDRLAERFGASQHRIYVDRPGQGASGRITGDHRPDHQAARVLAAARSFGTGRFIAIGHSWGGSVVAQMALNESEDCAGVVFVAPATHPWPGDRFEGVDWHYAIADTPIIGWLFTRLVALPFAWRVVPAGVDNAFAPEPAPPGYAETLRARLVLRPKAFQANAEDVHRLRPFVIAQSPRYPSIQAPTHIITGDADAVVWPHIHSDGLERDIEGAVKTVLPGAGHMPHQTHPDTVVEAIAAILDDAKAGTNA